MKCLEKDRNRRYETANGLARDIENYLQDEPVNACPPSRTYRLRKFARKNRKTLWAVSGFVILLLAAAGASTWQAVRTTRAQRVADRERQRAESAAQDALTQAAIAKAVNDFLNDDLLGQASPQLTPDRNLKVRTLLDRASAKLEGKFAQEPLVKAAIHATLGRTYE